MTHYFFENIPEDCKQAIREVKRMKVFTCAAIDYNAMKNFSDVWWCILHEVDLWCEGEFPLEEGGMTRAQAARADKWLVKYKDLAAKYETDGSDWSGYCLQVN